MIRQTLGDVKSEVARVCGSTGMQVTDTRVISRINAAQLELLNEGDFPGVVDRWHITTVDGNIVLPPNLDRLMHVAIAGVPRMIKSPWFEFVQYGPGPAEDQQQYNFTWCDVNGVLDRGETPTQVQLPDSSLTCGSSSPAGPWHIRVYGTVPEVGQPIMTIQGTDVNGLQVRTEPTSGSSAGMWIDGEEVIISSGSSFYQTTSQYTQVTVVTKPITNGYVKITAWNGSTELVLSTYAPNETTPAYRWYFSPWLQNLNTASTCCRTVRARCRRRFVPVAADTDVLVISNILAIQEMVIAQFKRESGNGDEYTLHKQTAVDLLKKEAMAYRGRSRIPGLTFQRGFALGTLPGLR